MRSDFCQTQWLKTGKIRGKTGSCRNEAADELREFFIKGGGEGIAWGKCRSGTSQAKTFEKGTYRYFRMDEEEAKYIKKGGGGLSVRIRAVRPALSKAGMPPWHQKDRKSAGRAKRGGETGRKGGIRCKNPKKMERTVGGPTKSPKVRSAECRTKPKRPINRQT